MEIKVGDKVRVSKDAPIHIIGSASEIECKAVALGTDADIAVIGFRTQEKQRYDAYRVPTKYLTKVEDEAKEPKFNVGDKVVVHYSTGDKMGRIQEVLYDGCYDVDYGGGCTGHHIIESRLYPYTEPTAPKIEVGSDELVDKQVWNCKLKQHGVIKRIANGCAEVFTQYGEHKVWSLVDLFDEYDEPFGNWKSVQPKGQTEAEEVARIRQMEAELDEFRKAELDRVSHPEKYHTYAVTIDNVAVDWQRYEADLAKEIAVKLSNPNKNKPGYVAEYAVSVAKTVVENLKKK